MASVPGFLTKTFEIFSSPEYADCCGWGANGDTIVIKKIEQFSKEVVPKFFKHSNFQSFVRQLNMYDFHKTVQDPSHGEFAHEFFKKGKPELLVHIKRKANKAPINPAPVKAKNAKSGSSSNLSNSTRASQNNAATSIAAPTANTSTVQGNSAAYGYGGGKSNTTYNAPAPSSAPTYALPQGLLPDLLYPGPGTDLEDSSLVGEPLGYFVDEGSNGAYPAHSSGHHSSGGGSGGGYYSDPFPAHQILPEDIATETDYVRMELNQQRALRENFERRMEQKLAALQGENNMLKRMFMESHHKNAVMQERMERVMKTLYNMFVGNGNGPGLALTNKAPSMLLTDIEHFEQQRAANGSSEGAIVAGSSFDGRYSGAGGSSSGAAGGGYGTRSSTLGAIGSPLLGRTRSTDSSALGRLDSGMLERLPSLDFAELDSLGGTPADPIPLNDTGSGSSNYSHLLRQPLAGTALGADSRGNSFDLAASSVTAPSLMRQSSFDSAYLPVPGNGASLPRTYLQPGNDGIASAGVGLSRPPRYPLQRDSSQDSSSDMTGTAVPLMRQRTFDYTATAQVPTAAEVSEAGEDALKRKLSGEQDAGDAKRTRSSDSDHETELQRLESEDLHSSLNEAHQFMDLLNRNQQTTLTRLDSLEQTLASLLDNASSEADTAHARSSRSGSPERKAGDQDGIAEVH